MRVRPASTTSICTLGLIGFNVDSLGKGALEGKARADVAKACGSRNPPSCCASAIGAVLYSLRFVDVSWSRAKGEPFARAISSGSTRRRHRPAAGTVRDPAPGRTRGTSEVGAWRGGERRRGTRRAPARDLEVSSVGAHACTRGTLAERAADRTAGIYVRETRGGNLKRGVRAERGPYRRAGRFACSSTSAPGFRDLQSSTFLAASTLIPARLQPRRASSGSLFCSSRPPALFFFPAYRRLTDLQNRLSCNSPFIIGIHRPPTTRPATPTPSLRLQFPFFLFGLPGLPTPAHRPSLLSKIHAGRRGRGGRRFDTWADGRRVFD